MKDFLVIIYLALVYTASLVENMLHWYLVLYPLVFTRRAQMLLLFSVIWIIKTFRCWNAKHASRHQGFVGNTSKVVKVKHKITYFSAYIDHNEKSPEINQFDKRMRIFFRLYFPYSCLALSLKTLHTSSWITSQYIIFSSSIWVKIFEGYKILVGLL